MIRKNVVMSEKREELSLYLILSPIELLNNNSHGLLPPGGLVSPSGGFVSLLCDQGLNFASILLCQASCSD